MNAMKRQLCYGLMLLTAWRMVAAQADLPSASGSHRSAASVRLQQSPEGEWRLQARQTALPQLLDQIAEQARLRIHYSLLPAATVSATCIGANVMELLQCVFSGSANIVSRRATSEAAKDEIWVMSSTLASTNTAATASCQPLAEDVSASTATDRAEQWLKQATDKDTETRAQAVSELARIDTAYDAKVRRILQNALTDQQPKVRARAIAAYAGREGEDSASEQLRQALQDNSVDVRQSAMDMIQTNQALLQLAVRNSDPTVRELAQLRLELLSQQQ